MCIISNFEKVLASVVFINEAGTFRNRGFSINEGICVALNPFSVNEP